MCNCKDIRRILNTMKLQDINRVPNELKNLLLEIRKKEKMRLKKKRSRQRISLKKQKKKEEETKHTEEKHRGISMFEIFNNIISKLTDT